ncbi:MAG: DUF294 nucleotidyltransferase-like domain-containing protein [Deferrisomatales bacterium]
MVKDESFFFVRIGDVSRPGVVTCRPDDSLAAVVAAMAEKNISGIVVCRDDRPVGMITDRDFRNQLQAICGGLGSLTAASIMTSPLVTVSDGDYVFEAIYKMARHNIHRLVVVDHAGCLKGILTDTDLINLQTTTPLYLNTEIRAAATLADLRAVNRRLAEVVSFATRTGARTRDLVRLISHFNDAITEQAIEILRRTRGLELPEGAAFLALGSEGRREQTLRTDQDNAAVYRDDLGPEGEAALEAFCVALVDALAQIGVPLCTGGTMASNPAWRRSLSGWTRELDRWLGSPTAENMVQFGVFQDLRTVAGDPGHEQALKEHLVAAVGRHTLFLAQVAKNILRFPPPLGWFGRIRLETSGEHKGELDLKKAGIFALTEGVALLALEGGITGGGTWDKLAAITERGLAPEASMTRVREAFTFLVYLRLKVQRLAVEQGFPPTNHVGLSDLTLAERERLKSSLQAVRALQSELKERYKVELLGN